MNQKKWGGKSRPENLPCQAVGDYSVTREGEPAGSASLRGKFGTAIIDGARSGSLPLNVAFRHTVALSRPRRGGVPHGGNHSPIDSIGYRSTNDRLLIAIVVAPPLRRNCENRQDST